MSVSDFKKIANTTRKYAVPLLEYLDKENITYRDGNERKYNKNKNSTPVMRQYWEAKKQYPDSIMLFRMGDFYETFDEDAKITSKILNIALTKDLMVQHLLFP